MSTEIENFQHTYSVRIPGPSAGDNAIEGIVPDLTGNTAPLVTEQDYDNFAKGYADFIASYFNEGAVHLTKDVSYSVHTYELDFYVTGS